MWLLPLIVLLTLLATVVPAEFLARRFYPEQQVDHCAPSAAGLSFHAKPNCSALTKTPEGPWALMRYNGCGFRTAEACGPKPPGTLRVAMLGSSTSAGFLTPYDDTMAVRAARDLTRRCRRAVEFQNLSAVGNRGARLVASAKAALRLSPDAIVLTVSETDLQLLRDAPVGTGKPEPAAPPNLLRRARDVVAGSRLLYLESFLLLRNDDTYVPLFLRSGSNGDFMRAPLSDRWRFSLAILDRDVRSIAMAARRARVPLLLLFVPQRAEAAIASATRFHRLADPFLLPHALADIARRNGIGFADGLDFLPKEAPSDRFFYAVNGHPNAQGHAVFANAIISKLTSPELEPFGIRCAGGAMRIGRD